MPPDHDAPRRLRIVREPPPQTRSPAAEAAARYRARKRGEAVPKRRPGPKRTTVSDLRQQNRDLHRRIAELESQRRILEERLRRQIATLTPERVARELLDVLDHRNPEYDLPERRVLLADLRAALEERQEHWPER